MMLADQLSAAYSSTAAAWRNGPARLYDRLAEVIVGLCPVPLRGRLLLDAGAGTGAVSKAVSEAGGQAIGLDRARGMLAVDRSSRPPPVVGDLLALPMRHRALDGVIAAFSLSHVADPAAGLREAKRVTRPGGAVIASVFAADDAHPVKDAVDAALAERGWREPRWHRDCRLHTVPALGTAEGCDAVTQDSGLDAEVHAVRVPFGDLDAGALVAWRLGMPHIAPFVASLRRDVRRGLVNDAGCRLGARYPPLVRSVLVITAVV